MQELCHKKTAFIFPKIFRETQTRVITNSWNIRYYQGGFVRKYKNATVSDLDQSDVSYAFAWKNSE